MVYVTKDNYTKPAETWAEILRSWDARLIALIWFVFGVALGVLFWGLS